jgi:hypothetical protein
VESFQRRHKAAEAYNRRLELGEISPGLLRQLWWTLRGDAKALEDQWRKKDGRKTASLTFAMNDAVFWWFWVGGGLKLFGDIAQMTSPLVVKEIIKFAQRSYTAYTAGNSPPSIGVCRPCVPIWQQHLLSDLDWRRPVHCPFCPANYWFVRPTSFILPRQYQ